MEYKVGVIYLADGRQPFETSGLWISRKFVSKVLREECGFEVLLPENDDDDAGDFSLFSVPCSILIASCIAKMISCILGLEAPWCSTHCMAISTILQMDSVLAFPFKEGSMMLMASPLRVNDLACKNSTPKISMLIFHPSLQHLRLTNERDTYPLNNVHFSTVIFRWHRFLSRYQFQQNNSKTVYVTLFCQLLACIVPSFVENKHNLNSTHCWENTKNAWAPWLTQDPSSRQFLLQCLIHGLNLLQLA